MRFIVYRTTNVVNSKYYIGKHQTKELNDGYLGSGIRLKRAISRYGKSNFIREILKECSSVEEMNAVEKQYLTESVLNDPNCYNLALGGQGGFLGERVRAKMIKSWTLTRRKSFGKLISTRWKDPNGPISKAKRVHSWNRMSSEQKIDQADLMSHTMKNLWLNKSHREKISALAKERMSANTPDSFKFATRGRKWMHHPELQLRKSVKIDEIASLQLLGWKFGKKITAAQRLQV